MKSRKQASVHRTGGGQGIFRPEDEFAIRMSSGTPVSSPMTTSSAQAKGLEACGHWCFSILHAEKS